MSVNEKTYDVTVVGAGLVGLFTALRLLTLGLRVALIERHSKVAQDQSGHNSEVLHAERYEPGSMKAQAAQAGRRTLVEFCATHDIFCRQVGELIVACDESEIGIITQLHSWSQENGLRSRILTGGQIRDGDSDCPPEPNVHVDSGLWIPETCIIDFGAVAHKVAQLVEAAGGDIFLGAKLLNVRRGTTENVLETSVGAIRTRHVVNCAGLYSDRVADMCGLERSDLRIVPFRGEYLLDTSGLVNGNVYPAPLPGLPFLGRHWTVKLDGSMVVGPNAVIALSREGYDWWTWSVRDLFEIATYPGSWRMAWKYRRVAIDEVACSLSIERAVRSLQRIVPDITASYLKPAGSGVRAQALWRDGTVEYDLKMDANDWGVHMLACGSPGATGSPWLGEQLAGEYLRHFGPSTNRGPSN